MIRYSSRVLMVAALVASPCVRAHAQTPCDTASTQVALDACAGRSARQSDERLGRLIADLRTHLDSTRFAAFEGVQRQWLTYRRSECKWEGDAFEGGSVLPMTVDNCIAVVTEARIAALKIHLCEGEGMTGDCAESRRYDVPRRATTVKAH